MTRPVAVHALTRVRLSDEARRADQDLLAVEAPLTVVVQPPTAAARPLGVLMRTPGHDTDLALGALLAEGVIRDRPDVVRVDAGDDTVTVHVSASADLSALSERGATATSACGLCGRLELLAVDASSGATPPDRPVIPAAVVAALPERLRNTQPAFAATGGLHAAALCTQDGSFLHLREDVGRHNAVDKTIGAWWQAPERPASSLVLLVSGRVAYEIVQKAARMAIPVIVAVGAPTSLAVEAARSAGLTLVGFARADRFNVYTFPERVG
jgi:FdhD protein